MTRYRHTLEGVPRLVLALVLCLGCGVFLSSCGRYVPVGDVTSVASAELPEGAHVRIHTVDGQRIDDILVRVGDDELECRSNTVGFASIELVEHRRPSPLDAVVAVVGGVAVLGGLMLVGWAIAH